MQVLEIGEEQRKVVVIDDFLETPEELVAFAEKAKFAPWPMAAERKGYPGVRTAAPENHANLIMDRIDSLIRDQFEIPAEEKLEIHQETLNLITVPEEELGPLQRAPHFD